MESLLAAALSLVILIPIIYFLPLGFTKRGKIIVLAISFILGNFGLVAKGIFPLWQAVLLMILIVFLIGILVDSRMKNVLYSIKFSSKEAFNLNYIEKESLEVEEGSPVENKDAVQINMYNQTDEKALTVENNEDSHIPEDETVDEIFEPELLGIKDIKLELENQIHAVNSYIENQVEEADMTVEVETKISQLDDDDDDLNEFDEDISFLLKRDESILGPSVTKAFIEHPTHEDIGYMSEIELLLENNVFIDELTEKPVYKIEISDMPVLIADDGDHLLDNEEIPRLNLEEIAVRVDDEINHSKKIEISMLQISDEKVLPDKTQPVEENMDWDDDVIEPIKEFQNK